MPTTPKAGDRVTWPSSQGAIKGTVLREQAAPTSIKGHKVAASKANPQLIVKSDQTGATAAHKPDAVKNAR